MSTIPHDLLYGAAGHLDTQGVGTWAPDDVLAGQTNPIVLGSIPAEIDTGIGLQAYRLGGDDPQHPTGNWNLQFWVRGATLAIAQDLDAAIYNAVQGLTDQTWGSVHVTTVESKSSIPMGVDDRGRWEIASNYTFALDLPATALRSY